MMSDTVFEAVKDKLGYGLMSSNPKLRLELMVVFYNYRERHNVPELHFNTKKHKHRVFIVDCVNGVMDGTLAIDDDYQSVGAMYRVLGKVEEDA